MDAHKFFVEKLRFHLSEENTLVFVGWFFDGKVKGHALIVRLDGEELPLRMTVNEGALVRQKYLGGINEISEEAVGVTALPEDWREKKRLVIYSEFEGKRKKACGISVKKLRKLEGSLEYYIESCRRDEDSLTVTGWCMGAGEVKLYLLDGRKEALQAKTEHYYRRDLIGVFPESDRNAKPGFLLHANLPKELRGRRFYLEMRNAEHYSFVRLKKWDDGTFWQFLMEKAGDTVRYFRRNGLAATLHKIRTKLARRPRGNRRDT